MAILAIRLVQLGPSSVSLDRLGYYPNLQVYQGTLNNYELYPNPNNGNFTLKGYNDGSVLYLEVLNAIRDIPLIIDLKSLPAAPLIEAIAAHVFAARQGRAGGTPALPGE